MMLLSTRRQWTRLPLWLEITLALLIKVAILTLLWHAFFSRPQTKHMRLPTATLEQHLLSTSNNTDVADQRIDKIENQPDLKGRHASH